MGIRYPMVYASAGAQPLLNLTPNLKKIFSIINKIRWVVNAY